MTIKSILCIFSGSEGELHAVETAFALGKAYGAHIRFLHISIDPDSYAMAYGYSDALAFSALRDTIEQENETMKQQAKKHIDALSVRYHVPLDSKDSPMHHASARFVHRTGHPETIIAEEGRMCDLIVIGRTAASAVYDDTVIAALFNTARPVMLLQGKSEPQSYKTIAVAWKATQEAARAVYNAMPFLEGAEKVLLLTATEDGETYDLAEEGALLEYLRTHGIQAQGIVVAAGSHTAGEALLIRARELGADLLVMGAYGHSRFRETLLGGVTNHALEKAEIPLLLSH